MLIVIARILKVLPIILLIAMSVIKMIFSNKNSESCINSNDINKVDINNVTDENPCKIHQESEKSKSREVSYSSEDFTSLLREVSYSSEDFTSLLREVSYSSEAFTSLLRDISWQNMNRIKISQLNINSIRNKVDL